MEIKKIIKSMFGVADGVDGTVNDEVKDEGAVQDVDLFDFFIKSIVFNDGAKIDLSKDDVVVIVGANNAGKSLTLKEINNKINNTEFNNKIIKNIEVDLKYSESALLSFVKSVSKFNNDRGYSGSYVGFGFDILAVQMDQIVKNLSNGFNSMTPVVSYTLTTEDRLSLLKAPKNISVTKDAAIHPIHHLLVDDKLEMTFSKFFHQAFGQDLIVHRNAGPFVPLYVGERPICDVGEDRASISYIKKIEQTDPLELQGDGMKSFAAVLLSAFISHHKVMFIDEPEAFLHPPQARLLGKMILKDMPSGRQIFMTTHSGDFLRGALDAGVKNLKVIRLNRVNNINVATVIDNEDIKQIWSDSILRHSNILDGLFHSQVVICESDSDNRFYSAVLASIYEADGRQLPDSLFIQCGGKARIPVVLKAFVKLNVPVKVISDFDLLNNVQPLKSIFEALGGDWASIEKDWKLVKHSIDAKRPELESEEVKKDIISILDSVTERIFPKDGKSRIDSVLKKASAWAHAKEQGKNFIPSGDPSQAYDRMQVFLKSKGLFVVEVGELEGFVRSVGSHGPKWVNDVMQKDLATDQELRLAREFIEQVIS